MEILCIKGDMEFQGTAHAIPEKDTGTMHPQHRPESNLQASLRQQHLDQHSPVAPWRGACR